jgi:hypothetical protein
VVRAGANLQHHGGIVKDADTASTSGLVPAADPAFVVAHSAAFFCSSPTLMAVCGFKGPIQFFRYAGHMTSLLILRYVPWWSISSLLQTLLRSQLHHPVFSLCHRPQLWVQSTTRCTHSHLPHPSLMSFRSCPRALVSVGKTAVLTVVRIYTTEGDHHRER